VIVNMKIFVQDIATSYQACEKSFEDSLFTQYNRLKLRLKILLKL